VKVRVAVDRGLYLRIGSVMWAIRVVLSVWRLSELRGVAQGVAKKCGFEPDQVVAVAKELWPPNVLSVGKAVENETYKNQRPNSLVVADSDGTLLTRESVTAKTKEAVSQFDGRWNRLLRLLRRGQPRAAKGYQGCQPFNLGRRFQSGGVTRLPAGPIVMRDLPREAAGPFDRLIDRPRLVPGSQHNRTSVCPDAQGPHVDRESEPLDWA